MQLSLFYKVCWTIASLTVLVDGFVLPNASKPSCLVVVASDTCLFSSSVMPFFVTKNQKEASQLQSPPLLTPHPPKTRPPLELFTMDSYTEQSVDKPKLPSLWNTFTNTLRTQQLQEQQDVIATEQEPQQPSVWQSFVAKADIQIGSSILKSLFQKAAAASSHQKQDNHGEESIMTNKGLEVALATGAFQWLDANHIQGIYDRAGGPSKGYVTLEEWLAEARKTLRPST